ncbi:hypothetical protein [Massilia genomosp. 1]|uniref:hypothetical protein n=1 Tax=Massilia genomosp. 1 TaxID=2609280 RepID=UPI00165260DB|nr:hypothetical protein [Massilia genomosp. 1]
MARMQIFCFRLILLTLQNAINMLKLFQSVVVLSLFLAISTVSAKDASPIQLGEVQAKGLKPKQAKQLLIFTLKHAGYNVTKRGMFFDGP